MKRICVSPLSWGLGHATRDLPLVRHFLDRGHEVTIAGSGRALALLKQEVPQCEFLELEDYPPPYTSSRHFVRKFIATAPLMLTAMVREKENFERILRHRTFDLILSDNRFNVRSPDIPSFIISHQVRFMVPKLLRSWEFVTESWNARFQGRFRRVIVPDYADPAVCLSGRMSHGLSRLPPSKLYYAGILASVERMDVEEDVDVFVSVSGPEPQRTEFERIVMDRIEDVPGDRIEIALGKPEVREKPRVNGRITVHGYLDREAQQRMLNRARMVVCRSGYTTLMELAELGKKALLVPTPGQTEQEYLAEYHAERGFFHAVSQYDLDLRRDLKRASEMTGIPFRTETRADVERLYEDIFEPVLGE